LFRESEGFEPPPILELRIYELRISRIHPLLILHFIPNQKGTSATRSEISDAPFVVATSVAWVVAGTTTEVVTTTTQNEFHSPVDSTVRFTFHAGIYENRLPFPF